MFELIYPLSQAPLLPPRTADDCLQKIMARDVGEGHGKKEMFPVVEPNGLVIGQAAREYCHSGAKPLHPVVHLHIIDRESCLYLQKRSMKKDIQPGKWDTAVGGHISYGESILEALYREASEELGLSDFNPVYIRSYVFESEVEKELVNVFAAVGHYALKPDLDEVDGGRFWEIGEIEENLGKSIFTPNFEGEFVHIKDTLLSLL